MAMSYNPKDFEKKWQDVWEKDGVYRALDHADRAGKFYGLIEFPYPSGEGLHVGHPRSYTAIDIMTRKQRMEGKDVLYPIGWDAFGLPTENFAIKHKVKPQDATKKNVANFARQLKSLGFGFDWSREVNTTDPTYYKWTQWMFLQFVKYGMAYKATTTINWCPSCKIGLANEEAQGGVCERCGGPVEKREKAQWMIRITKYADRLVDDLKGVDYLEKIKAQQINWIGKSEGAEIQFTLTKGEEAITVFTTRPDTLFGATYLVMAPEHKMVGEWITSGAITNADEVNAYRDRTRKMTDIQRQESREKTGVELKGIRAVNPATGEEIPVWIADYVLASYGTGAIMAVPAHDERDFEFAKTFDLPIRQVVSSGAVKEDEAMTDEGVAVNSGFLDGLATTEAKQKMIAWLEEKNVGARQTQYKLRDWVFSRQRYWGEPIPLVHCDACAQVKQKVLLVHGFEATSDMLWFPWMKAELEARGFEVIAPTMPNSHHPNLSAWMDVLVPAVQRLGEDDVIVAHSLGAHAALRAVATAKKKIGSMYLVASAFGEVSEAEWSAFGQAWDGSDIAAVRAFYEQQLPWDETASLVTTKKAVFSDNDPEVPTYLRAVPAGWHAEIVRGKGHFQQNEAPELLDIVLQSKASGWIPVPDSALPVTLPDVEAYQPTDTGESPLANIPEWVNVSCPKCGGPATRETDTMPNWAGSSWYFLRYCDPKNDAVFADPEKLKFWMPVDLYNGGMEHTTLHLLYSRFWHKFLWDIGAIPKECGSEPYAKRRSHALILGEGGVKMSKSKGNVVNPDDVVAEYGADVFRLYQMFIGPFDQDAPWDTHGIEGVKRFMEKIWRLAERVSETATLPEEVETILHQTIKKVGDDIESMNFNTAVSAMMILVNALGDVEKIPMAAWEKVLKILAPFAPHATEELWQVSGHAETIHRASWPVYDAVKLHASTFELVIQVNGKVRDRVTVSSSISEDEVKSVALSSEKVKIFLEGKAPQKVVYVKGRLVSISV